MGLLLVLLKWLAPAFAVAWIFLRHVPFALLVAVSPLPGVFFTGWLMDRSDPSQYAFGFCTGLLLAGTLVRRDLSAGGNWRTVAWAAAGGAITAIGLDRPSEHDFALNDLWRWRPVVPFVLSALSAAGLVAAGRRVLPFGEDFITRANRAAETRARVLEVAAQIAVPRWALALSGIAMVMAALAWFDVAPPHAAFRPGFFLATAAVIVLARDWRAAAAAAASVALLWLFRADAALPFFSLPLLLLAGASRGREEQGAPAWQRTLEEEGASLLFAALGGTVLLALGSTGTWLAGMEAFIASLIFYPAVTVALWSVFPPHRRIEDLYRG